MTCQNEDVSFDWGDGVSYVSVRCVFCKSECVFVLCVFCLSRAAGPFPSTLI
jgi:hypothetical protein